MSSDDTTFWGRPYTNDVGLTPDNDGIMVEDLNSSNGVSINDNRVQKAILHTRQISEYGFYSGSTAVSAQRASRFTSTDVSEFMDVLVLAYCIISR